jgi:hypothetical protein
MKRWIKENITQFNQLFYALTAFFKPQSSS